MMVLQRLAFITLGASCLVTSNVIPLRRANGENDTAPLEKTKPFVQIGAMKYEGEHDPRGFYAFNNVRFGMAPLGDRRFRRPLAVPDDFTFVWEKDEPIQCPQAAPHWECDVSASKMNETTGRIDIDDAKYWECIFLNQWWDNAGLDTEDCLFLDVFVPAALLERDMDLDRCGQSLAPVVVTFGHPSFTHGSKASGGFGVDPSAITTRVAPDVPRTGCGDEFQVSVAANFRLGMFGWLAEDAESANIGLWDQRLALEWVQAHIGKFGGDATRVTLTGLEGSAGSIMHHVTAFNGGQNPHPSEYHPSGTAPFSSAIMLLPQWDFTINPMFAHYMVMGEATTLAGRPITTLEDLRLLESQTLMEVNRRVVRPAPKNTRVFGPVIGGDFAPQHPGVSLREGLFEPSLRLIVGHGSWNIAHLTPMTNTREELDAALTELMNVYPNSTLEVIVKELYNDTAREELASLYGVPERLPRLWRFPRPVLTSVNVAKEIFMGCNLRSLGKALPNSTYIYDVEHVPAQGIVGLFSRGRNVRMPHVVALDPRVVSDYRDRFLRFIHTGEPESAKSAMSWPVYGEEGIVFFAAPDRDLRRLKPDVFDNGRCRWWVTEGYEQLKPRFRYPSRPHEEHGGHEDHDE